MGEARVYLVDDNAGFRDSTAWLLETAGFEAVPFASGPEFIEAYGGDRHGAEHEQIADFAVEGCTDRGEGGEPNRLRAVVLENREVDDAQIDQLAQSRQRHPALFEQLVQAAVDDREVFVHVCTPA